MDYRTKRAVVATLIKAGRRDLACVVAGKWPSLTVKTILEALKIKKVATPVLDAVAKLAAGRGLTREQLEGVLSRFTGSLAKDAARVAKTFGLYEGMMLGMDVNPMRLQTARRSVAGIKVSKRPPSQKALLMAPTGSQLNWTVPDEGDMAYTAERLSDTTWEIRSGGELVDEARDVGALLRHLTGGTDFFWD